MIGFNPDHSSQTRFGRVLVTGAAGFIGSHLVEAIAPFASHVRAFVRYNSRNGLGWLEDTAVLSDIEVVSGDVRDFESVSRAVKGCDAVFHLAALIGIPYSYLNPLSYVRTNVEGTYNVLQSAREHEASNVIVTSTSETYGTLQYAPMDELHPSAAQSPYAATKTGADQLALSYHRSFGTPVKVVRPFNTYGPRQSSRAIIPTVITQLLGGAKKLHLGNLSPTRDLTYVTDTADGFLAIAESEECVGSVTNVGMNAETSVGDLVQMIAGLMNVAVEVEADPSRIRPDSSEVLRLRCDNSKILAKTRWRPRHDLEQGLQKTVEWFRLRSDNTRTRGYVV
jgi:NAD dependent epimerase/dehydratase